jgi:putative NIF3 family GTP cyclohydrolase 1 type 2
MISGKDLTRFLDDYFAAHLYFGDQCGLYRDAPSPVRRIGLALEATPELARWASPNGTRLHRARY